MTCREYAKSNGFEIVGKLKKMPDSSTPIDPFNPMRVKRYADEAGNEYHMGFDGSRWDCFCIVAVDGTVI